MGKSFSLRATASALSLFAGDVLTLYASLVITLLIHPGQRTFHDLFALHIVPFSILFALWLVIFYIAGLYEISRLPTRIEFLKVLVVSCGASLVLGVCFFYVTPQIGVTPKTNLAIFFLVYMLLQSAWRPAAHRFFKLHQPGTPVLLIGNSTVAERINYVITDSPQLGYKMGVWVREESDTLTPEKLGELIRAHEIKLIAVPWDMKFNSSTAQLLYNLLHSGIRITDFPAFYEHLAQKIPLEELGESWILEHLADHQRLYDPIKKIGEFILAVILQIIVLPLEGIIALLILLTSGKPVLYRQERVGKKGEPFTIYKFRTFTAEASRTGVRWAASNDPRITPFGKILRKTHLDELPQLYNILRGNLSFVGPRPEPAFLAEVYFKEIPYYNVRHLVTPGLTGWAQLRYPATPSVPDTMEKLQYDVYYIKNRSPLLDIAIMVKTVKSFFSNPQ
jgi:exopolysaccharide biosynthesis polyprenyl glycosylphosphotransferase